MSIGSITRKTLLYKSEVEYADFCLNHVEGCSHGCRYPCYAMMMKKRCGIIKSYEEWCKPKIVSNALELLDREIPKYKNKIKYVHLCFSTDPFMYKQDEVIQLSLKIIAKLNNNGVRCNVLTKGVYPDELVSRNGNSKLNEYGITLVSLSEEFRKNYEPHAAPFKERINSLKKLRQKGFKTWVSIEPYPTPNILRQDLKEILETISFVDRIIFGKLNYNVKSSQFECADEFYRNNAKEIVNFCKKNKISYHIKHGTTKNTNRNGKR
jgi:DNA repair photolyase